MSVEPDRDQKSSLPLLPDDTRQSHQNRRVQQPAWRHNQKTIQLYRTRYVSSLCYHMMVSPESNVQTGLKKRRQDICNSYEFYTKIR